jgi:hypothetical protein
MLTEARPGARLFAAANGFVAELRTIPKHFGDYIASYMLVFHALSLRR